MRYSLIFGAVSGLAAAMPAPAPQATIDSIYAGLSDVPKPTTLGAAPLVYSSVASTYAASTITPVAAASETTALAKRQDSTASYDSAAASSVCAADGTACCALPTNTALAVPTPDTASAFISASFASAAVSAATPSGYTVAFTNQQASVEEVGYLGVYSYDTYDVDSCAAECSASTLCQGFNIYIERDPTVLPDNSTCADPPSTAFVKCTLYGYPVAVGAATNAGQYVSSFQIVIAGSNGYNKAALPAPAAQPDFTGPSALLPGALQNSAYYTYEFYNNVPFDPSVCAAGCQRNTAWNAQHPDADGDYDACNEFNVYVLFANDVPQGLFCSYYDTIVDDADATNTGYTNGDTVYSIGESYTYTLTTQDPGTVGNSTSSR